jgi:hypothetical protein
MHLSTMWRSVTTDAIPTVFLNPEKPPYSLVGILKKSNSRAATYPLEALPNHKHCFQPPGPPSSIPPSLFTSGTLLHSGLNAHLSSVVNCRRLSASNYMSRSFVWSPNRPAGCLHLAASARLTTAAALVAWVAHESTSRAAYHNHGHGLS